VLTGAGPIWDDAANGAKVALGRVAVAAGCVVSGLLSGFAGLILHTVLRRFQEFEHHFGTVSHELRVSRFERRELDAEVEEPRAVD
jgi:hypothetical protein